MATLGDLNPNLYKKSQLQLENEARAQQQAQQDAINRQSKDYIGTGVTPDQIRVTQAPKPFYEPSMNLSGIQENSYMGPTATMGQLNPALNQKTQLQLENEARQQKMTAQPSSQPTYQGETDLMRQAREHNQAVIDLQNAPRNTTSVQYDQNALNAQSGYGKTYGGRQNIAPELFTNRVASKVGTDARRKELDTKINTLSKEYNRMGRMMPERGHYSDEASFQRDLNLYQQFKDAMKESSDYNYSPEAAQRQQEINQESTTLAGREASELAQNLGNMGNTGQQQPQGYGLPSTGDATADMNIAMSNQMMRENEQLINDDKIRNDNLLRNQLINSYMQTNISDLGYNKEALNKMTTEQLMSLGSAEGLDMSTAVKDKLSAFGKLQIENEKLNRDFELADVEMTRRQMERQLGRSITEQEDFNTQQDTKLRRMLGMFGGGKVQDLAGNMAVMDAQQKGITALADLRADYGDRMDSLGRMYNKINSSHAMAIKGIEYETNNKIETAFVNLQNKIDGYITSGVTNEKELNKVMMQGKKDFVKTYMEETSKAADRIQKQNEVMFNQVMALKAEQRADDKAKSEITGFRYLNGEPMLNRETGLPIPTRDELIYQRDTDKYLSERDGFVYSNGRLVYNTRGETIPTLTARKFEQDINQFEQTYGLNVAKFNQDAQQFGMNYALAQQKFAQDSTMDNAKFMMDAEKNGYDVSLVGASSTSFNGANAKYSPVATPDGSVQFNIRTGTVPPNGREQCGEFVNDALGMKVFGNEIEQKRSKITTQIPNAGSAFVQSTQGPYGHVGLIEAVSGTDALGRPTALRFVDSNYGENGVVQRGVMTISYDKNGNPTYKRNGKVVRIDGFTDGILPSAQREQARTGESQYGPQRPERTITGESARIGQQYGPERPVGSYKAEAPQAPVTPQQQFQVGNMLLTKRAGGGQQQIISDPKQRFDLEFKLAGDFDTDTKAARTAFTQKGVLDNAFAKAEQDASSGKSMNASSQAIVIAFNKILDPTSVVREGEYARSAEGQAYLTAMQGKVQQIQQGGAGLTIDSLRDLKETADRFMQGYESSIKDKAQQTEMFAKNYGLNTENIFTPNAKSILKSLNQSSARDQARQALSNAGYDTSEASIDLYLKNQ